jgi:imidazolonepropionase-like amidohydrolase
MRSLACVSAVALSGLLLGAQPAAPPLFISGVTVIDGTGSAPSERSLLIRGDRIDRIVSSGTPPRGTTVVAGRGLFAIPGLWDMHVHLAVRPEPELAERIVLPLFLAHGIVGVRDMGGPLERLLALRDRVKRGELTGPRILTPGPFVDGPGDPDPLFRRVRSSSESRDTVADLSRAGVDFVKVQANLTREAYDAVIAAARDRKIVVAGHVPMAIPASDVIESGQRSLEHVSPALVGDAGVLFACSSREAELRTELLAIERDRSTSPAPAIRAREAALRSALVESYDAARATRLGQSMRRRGAWMVPTLIWSNSFRPLSASDTGEDVPLEFVPAATRARWRAGRAAYLKAASPADFDSAARVAEASAKAVGALHAAGASVLAGTDTFDGFDVPGVSLHQELALLVQAGLTPLEALRSATRNAAAYRGALATEGTLEAGKRADLVLLDANPLSDIRNIRRVHAVVRDGKLLDRAALDVLLDQARTAARQ